jgi:hypothetical protein
MSDYINNEKFLELLKEFQKLNDDTTQWYLKQKKKSREEIERREKIRESRILLLETETDEERKSRIRKLNKVKEQIGKCFLSIAEGLMKRPNFINYDYFRKCEMMSNATFYMVNYIDRYDINKDNPFAYFTQVAFNAYRQHINSNKKVNNLVTNISYIENVNSFSGKIIEGVYVD